MNLIVSLDDNVQFTNLSINSVITAINNNQKEIITPCIQFFDASYTKRYQVYAVCNGNKICLNEMLENKEIRYAQSSAGMLYANVFADKGIIVDKIYWEF